MQIWQVNTTEIKDLLEFYITNERFIKLVYFYYFIAETNYLYGAKRAVFAVKSLEDILKERASVSWSFTVYRRHGFGCFVCGYQRCVCLPKINLMFLVFQGSFSLYYFFYWGIKGETDESLFLFPRHLFLHLLLGICS